MEKYIMRFQPLTEEEIQIESLIPEGIYSYHVVKSEDKISQSGNEYIALTLKIWDQDGKERLVYTNLALIKLLKHFCDVNNMQDLYQLGEIEADKCLDKSGGRVQIGAQLSRPDGKGGMYPAKSIVRDYVSPNTESKLNPLGSNKDTFSDDAIPF
jgi:hypothetical protein